MPAALTTRQIERCIRNNQWDQAIAGVLEHPPTARHNLKPHIDAIGRHLLNKGHHLIDLEAPRLPGNESESTSNSVACLKSAWSILYKVENLGFIGHETEVFVKKLHAITLILIQSYLNNGEPGPALDWIERVGASGCTAPRLKMHNDLSEHWIRALNLAEIDMIPEALNHAHEALLCPSAMAHPAVTAHLNTLITQLESRLNVTLLNEIIFHESVPVDQNHDTPLSLKSSSNGTRAIQYVQHHEMAEYFPEPPNAAGLCFCLWINGMGGYLCLFEERVTLGNIYSPKAHVHIQAHMHESHAIISRTGPIMQIQPADEFCTVYINDQRLSRDGQVLQNSQKIRFDDWNPKFEFTWHQFEGSGPGGMLLPSESRRLQPGIERVILEVNRIAIGPETHCAIRTQAIDLKKTIYLVRENQHVVIVVPDGVDHLGARRLIATVGTQHMVGNLSFSLTHAYESNTINS